MLTKIKNSYFLIPLASLLGILTGYLHYPLLIKGAHFISSLTMNFLQLIAAPLVFLSIFSTLLGIDSFKEMKTLGRKAFFYTLITTVLAAGIALVLFLYVNPAKNSLITTSTATAPALSQNSYLSFLANIVPQNIVKAFLENHVIGIAFISILLGIASAGLPKENKTSLHLFFSSCFQLLLKLTTYIVTLMPLAIWAFVTLLFHELQGNTAQFHSLFLYLGVVLGANLIQGFLVLPLLLKFKGLSPWKIFKGSSKALLLAFFSKSSNATLPVSLKCAETMGLSPKVAGVSLPLCTVINMNGCAAFILTTVLFVAQLHGVVFTMGDYGLWILLATLAAIGNAGVPMGCFFLSSTFLVGMGVPLTTLGIILPFYAFLDMVETSLNVWSDLCVTAVLDKDLKKKPLLVEG
ncbi:MAG: dicarboxylate/amino acid:cation symporter [Chlamydiae bacterium]|nr:dicarboxylate/amino acid:cation symporter [Chlamydiota bacterium]